MKDNLGGLEHGTSTQIQQINVEQFFLHNNVKNMIMELIKKLDLRLSAVHLVDVHLCSDPGKYLSALLLFLSTMLHLELPHVNILLKIDLIESYGKLEHKMIYATGGRTKVPIYVTRVIKVDNAEISVLDGDLGNVETRKTFTVAAVQEKYIKDDENFDVRREVHGSYITCRGYEGHGS